MDVNKIDASTGGRKDAPSSAWHELGLTYAEIEHCCTALCCSAETLRQADRDGLIAPMEDATLEVLNGYLDMLERGRDWLIEPLKTLQPRSWAILAEDETQFCVGVNAWTRIPDNALTLRGQPYAFFFVRGRAIEVEGYGIDDNYETAMSKERYGWRSCLPDVLTHSWLWRVNGWRIVTQLPTSIYLHRQMVPAVAGGGFRQIDDVLETYGKGYKKKYLPQFKEHFPNLVDKKHKIFLRLRCLLDTRPEGVNGPVGDQLFVFLHEIYEGHWTGTHIAPPAIDATTVLPPKTVYHIHRGDAGSLRIIPDEYVGEIFDRYSEHVLTRTPGEFDFMSYSRPA